MRIDTMQLEIGRYRDPEDVALYTNGKGAWLEKLTGSEKLALIPEWAMSIKDDQFSQTVIEELCFCLTPLETARLIVAIAKLDQH
jgi:hypothetical protein